MATPPLPVTFITGATAAPRPVHRKHDLKVTSRVTASEDGKVLMDVEIYGPKGHRVKQHTWTVTLTGGARRDLAFTWHVGAHRKRGRYTVKVGVFEPSWASLLSWNNAATTFRVR